MKTKNWNFVVSFFIILVALLVVARVQAVEVTATVSVGSFPSGIVYDSGKGEMFVANYGNNTVSVISDCSNTVISTIKVGIEPQGIAYDSIKGEIFVANKGDNTVSVISDLNNTVVATIPAWGIEPCGIAYDSGKGELFTANYESNTVSVISDSNNTVIETIKVGNEPCGIAYDSGKGELFVANSNSPSDISSPGTVSVINDSKIVASYPGIPTSSPVVATVNLENTPIAIAYDPLKGEVFVGNAIVSDNNNSVVATISFPEGEGGPYSICYDSGKEVIFYGGSLGLNVTVLAMDDNSNVFVAALTLPRGTPSGIAFDSSNGELYVVNNWQPYNSNGTVFVISDSSLPSVTPSPTASAPPSPSASPTSPSPTIPEFSTAAIILVIVVLLTVFFGAVVVAVNKSKKSTRITLIPSGK